MRKFDKNSRRGLYRSRNGIIFGVCRGTAEYFDFSVFWARMITVVLLFLTGLWPLVGIYIVAALLMKPEPVIPIKTEAEKEFYDSYTHSRHGAAQRLKRRYQNLERRIRRMEHVVTTPEFNWEKRFNK
jgi:phage shock protein C